MVNMYTLDLYDTISKNNTYVLSSDEIDKLNTLHKHMGVHNLPVKPTSIDNIGRRSKTDSVNNWKKREDFKVTVIAKKEGCESLLGELKKYLNKLTILNYDTQFILINDIMEQIHQFQLDIGDTDNDKSNAGLSQAIDLILHVACTNKYYSMLYANLYSHLVTVYSYFLNEKTTIYNKLLSSLDDIESVDPNEDYDKFCVVTKQNDERRAHMLFVINLFKNGNFTMDELRDLIKTVNNMISLQLMDSARVEYTNELTEIMNVFVSNMVPEMKKTDDWKFIQTHIIEYSKYKNKDYPGLSSRTIFKYMGMVDLFK